MTPWFLPQSLNFIREKYRTEKTKYKLNRKKALRLLITGAPNKRGVRNSGRRNSGTAVEKGES